MYNQGEVLKKQTAISHSSSEAEVIALDAAIRMEGLPALCLWEEVVSIFGPKQHARRGEPRMQRQRNEWSTGNYVLDTIYQLLHFTFDIAEGIPQGKALDLYPLLQQTL